MSDTTRCLGINCPHDRDTCVRYTWGDSYPPRQSMIAYGQMAVTPTGLQCGQYIPCEKSDSGNLKVATDSKT